MSHDPKGALPKLTPEGLHIAKNYPLVHADALEHAPEKEN